jgi:uncharacterized protein (DUF885 family)
MPACPDPIGRRSRSRWRAVATACLVLGLTNPLQAAPAPAPAAAMHRLLDDYDRYLDTTDPDIAARRHHIQATSWPDNTPAAVASRYQVLLALQRRLAAIPAGALSGEDRLNHDLLTWRIGIEVDAHRFDQDRIPFTADEGFFVEPLYASETTPIRTEADASAWMARIQSLPAYYDREIANMRRGLATGFTQPKITASAALATTSAAAALPPQDDALMAPFAQLPPGMPAPRQAALRAQALDAVRTQVKPAEQKLAAFFRDEYLPKSRDSIGAAALPDGRAYYAWRARSETTTDLTPDQIFAIGTSEIARIRADMQQQITASGFKGDFRAFQDFLRHDPRFYVTTREALLEKASRLAKRVDDQLPRFIGRLPRLTYGVRPVPAALEEGYTSGRYDPGDPDKGVAGGLMINTSHLDQRPLYELPSLVAHEGVPGHHIQIALAQEMKDLPYFRQQSDITAYVEGWAVYAEQLVDQMGLYQTPYEHFGNLSMQMWRACRLVMDVGIHWKGWTRDQALACLRDNTALADKDIQNETNRYIAWPGQALGYWIGEMKLMQLRHRAQAAFGENFDERAFHDEILDEGAMPLAVLDSRVDDWIASHAHTSADQARAP